jgi:hypothetical protein
MYFLKYMNVGIFLTLLLGIWGPIDSWMLNSSLSQLFHWIGVFLTMPLLFLAWGLGLHLSLGRLQNPSQGAVDNGSACAILMGLAYHLNNEDSISENTRITLEIFTGEEVNMQGSRAFTQKHKWEFPSAVLNLEIMAQDGAYIYWENEGNAFITTPTEKRLNEIYSKAVEKITKEAALPAPLVNSDGFSFLRAGIPATTVGTLDTVLGETGFHRPTDNLTRVAMRRLPEGIEILNACIKELNRSNVVEGENYGP